MRARTAPVRAPGPRGRHSSSHRLPVTHRAASHRIVSRATWTFAGNRPVVTDPHRLALGTEAVRPPEGDLRTPSASLQLPSRVVLGREEHRSLNAGAVPPAGDLLQRRGGHASPHRDRGGVGGVEDLEVGRLGREDRGGWERHRVPEDDEARRRHEVHVDLCIEGVTGCVGKGSLLGHHETDAEGREEGAAVTRGAGQDLAESELQVVGPGAGERPADVEHG